MSIIILTSSVHKHDTISKDKISSHINWNRYFGHNLFKNAFKSWYVCMCVCV